ncbi:uncharacterized protein J3R85_008011 [Psidium guajava]|nr:uncharacterized protein J3R85_008011 [Psidium guajava]
MIEIHLNGHQSLSHDSMLEVEFHLTIQQLLFLRIDDLTSHLRHANVVSATGSPGSPLATTGLSLSNHGLSPTLINVGLD